MEGSNSRDMQFLKGVGKDTEWLSFFIVESTTSISWSKEDTFDRLLVAEKTDAGVHGDLFSAEDDEVLRLQEDDE